MNLVTEIGPSAVVAVLGIVVIWYLKGRFELQGQLFAAQLGRVEDRVAAQLGRVEDRVAHLEVSMKDGFARVDARLDGLSVDKASQREMDLRFDRVDDRFSRVDDRFSRLDERLDDVAARVDRLTSETALLRSDVTQIALAVGARPREETR